jgi:hypothetical protein
MKTGNKKSYYSAIILFFVTNTVYSQGLSLDETFEWSYDVNPGVEVFYKNYDCDTKIETSGTNRVYYELTVHAKAKKPEDLDILKSYFQDLDFSASESRVKLSSDIYAQIQTRNSKTIVELKSGEKINLSSLVIEAILKIPPTSSLYLNSRFSNIELGDIHRLELISYDDDIHGNNIDPDTQVLVDARFSRLYFKEAGNANIKVYESTLEFNRIKDANIDSRFSDLEITRTNNLKVESYEDDLSFHETGDLTLSAQFSEVESKKSQDLNIVFYECNLNIPEVNNLTISDSKYSKYEIGNLKNAKIEDLYEDNFTLKDLHSMEVQVSRFSNFEVEKLHKSLMVHDGYEDKVDIQEVMPEFVKYYHKGRFVKTRLKINPSLSFQLDCSGNFLDFNNEIGSLTILTNKTNGSVSEIKAVNGTRKDNMPLIHFEGYEMDLILF